MPGRRGARLCDAVDQAPGAGQFDYCIETVNWSSSFYKTLDYEGKPTVTYKVGETFSVDAGKIHEGINNGNVPIKALASFVTPKGQALTAQAN